MEQLPPHNWTIPPPPPSSAWLDEFLHFSASRRTAHRRHISDPIAFVENRRTFDRLDDDQLTTMFSDLPSAADRSSSTPSAAPSDRDSDNDDKKLSPPSDRVTVQPKAEPAETDGDTPPPSDNITGDGDAIVDPKRIKRILANRQSAQRSRVRKLQYISELERSVTSLQNEVSTLSPRVAYLDHQRLVLNVDNSALKQRIAALAQDNIFKDAHQEVLRKEIERLQRIYQQQNIKTEGGGAPPPAVAGTEEDDAT